MRIPKGWNLALAAGLCFGLANVSQAQTVSLAQQRTETINGQQYLLTSKLKSIVLGEFTFGFNHTVGYPNLDSTISRIGKAETPAWTVTRMTQASQVTSANLANYQVFFANYISGFGGGRTGGFTSAQQTALQDFVETQGKGIFLMHSSGDSPVNTSWPWYSTTLMPNHYTGEAGAGSSNSTGKVGIWSQNNKAAKSHPIMEGIGWGGTNPDTVSITGMELHTFDKAITNSSITPVKWQGLLGLNAATCGRANTCSGGSYNYTTAGGPDGWPISWTFPAKKGSVGYFMEGHDLVTMNNMTKIIWDKYFKQFMYYIAGYDTVLVTTGINKSSLDFSIDASGITFHPAEVGVLINKPGNHIVSLYDIAGHKVKEMRGSRVPVDYNWSEELKSKSGVYVMRVSVSGAFKSRRFFVK